MLLDTYRNADVPLIEAFDTSYPAYFLHPLVEYNALVNHVGIIDLTHWRVLTVAGNDRASFLHNMLTNDITALADGEGCHSVITAVNGKIIAELFVFARENDYLVLMPSGDLAEVLTTLEKHIINEDVTITDLSGDFGVLAVEGPKALNVVKRLFLTGALEPSKNRFGIVSGGFETFELSVINNTCSGDDGYHVVVPAAEVARIREYLVQGARGSDGLSVGHTAWNVRRIENGIPWHGIDYTTDNFPPESRLDHTVSYTKGCFRGQQTLGRIHNRGDVNWLLVGLTAGSDVEGGLEQLSAEIDGLMSENRLRARADADAARFDLSSVFPAGSDLFAGEDADDPTDAKPIGRITSAIVSPRRGGPLFLGYVRREIIGSTTTIRLSGERTGKILTVCDLPLAQHSES